MSNVESAIIPGVRITPAWRLALVWVGASVIAVPLAVLLHEVGHALVYLIFGFPDVVLHYNSATYSTERTFWQLISRGNIAAAASIIPVWKVGIATLAGIVVTCVAALVCCFFAARKNPQPFVFALGVFAPVRFLSGIPVVTAWLTGKPVRAGTDEAHLAALTGIPIIVLVFAGLVFLGLVWIWMVGRIPKDHRWTSLGGLVSGLALGIVIYFWWIGPGLLP